MKPKQLLPALTLGAVIFFLPACQPQQSGPAVQSYLGGYTYHGVSFGKNLSKMYKRGIRDGCETSRGIYTKSHRLFNDNNDYYNGWFLGRKRCRHLLKVDEDGNLIL